MRPLVLVSGRALEKKERKMPLHDDSEMIATFRIVWCGAAIEWIALKVYGFQIHTSGVLFGNVAFLCGEINE